MNYAFLVILFASIAVALRWGGHPEKWGAAVLIAMTVVQVLGYGILSTRFAALDWVGLAVDCVGLASFTAIALFAWRIWPLWASALQLFSLTTHLVRVIDIHLHPAVYWLMKSSPTFGVCLILIAATRLHRQRVKTRGHDRSWMEWRHRSKARLSTPTIPRS